MDPRATELAARVIGAASPENPADAVLRKMLREPGVSRVSAGEVSHAVFAYYRWLGWLDATAGIAAGIQQALELAAEFKRDVESIPAQELKRAIPEWAFAEMDVATPWLRTLQAEPTLWIRAKRGTGEQLAMRLGGCRVAGPGALADALAYEGNLDLFRTPEFHAGFFELQDITSQMVGLLCDPQPTETWWDACAGEGGKTLHLSDLKGNKGLIWASDRAAWRLEKLKRRAARAGVHNYRAVLWPGGPKPPTKTKFDGILVDAPCSGLGTWQRNPHARWTALPRDVADLAALQQKLLVAAIPALKPGGRLIYSVCTMARKETVEIARFMEAEFPQLKPLAFINPLKTEAGETNRVWFWPQATRGNGMFVCGWEAPK